MVTDRGADFGEFSAGDCASLEGEDPVINVGVGYARVIGEDQAT